MALIIPTGSLPGQNPGALWSMQLQLMELAEDTLGPRDASKTILQPVFTDDNPQIRNTLDLQGAFAELSRNAEGYWPTTVYELAHETVHLLSPKPGAANWLEEGIAMSFADYAQRQYGLEPQSIKLESYRTALKLASALPPGALAAGRRIRDARGDLNKATGSILEMLFPSVDSGILAGLCQQFEREWSEQTS